MKKIKKIIHTLTCLLFVYASMNGQELLTYVDNQKYWKDAAKKGLAELNPEVEIPAAVTKSTFLSGVGMIAANSPDVVIIEGNTSQSENSIAVDPTNDNRLLNSNNSLGIPGNVIHGANDMKSSDQGATWNGNIQGVNGTNFGDPATAIGLDGTYYIDYIDAAAGQAISISNDQGQTWVQRTIASTMFGALDKNHLTIDNSTQSPFVGRLYAAWTPINSGSLNDNEIELTRSANSGDTWSTPISISNAVNAGNHNQGVNIQTGPDGQVYAVWAIYDSWPSAEVALGFSKSVNGATTFQTASRIVNISGIRNVNIGKNMSTNSFPVMAVDNSSGPNRGNIYIVWANLNPEGTGDVDVLMIRSTDDGDTWSNPIVVNQDIEGEIPNVQYHPWITCDPCNGNLHVVFYDDRNVGGLQVETFVANSFDGGVTWNDMRVSDVAFTPSPIPGTRSGYFGDYLGITAQNGVVFPVWTDNRSGVALSYTSPFAIGCVDDIILQDVVVGIGENEVFEASNSISTAGMSTKFEVKGNGTIGGNTQLSAGDNIRLLPGTVVESGGALHAEIKPCTNNSSNLCNLEAIQSSVLFKLRENVSDLHHDLNIEYFPNPTYDGHFNVDISSPETSGDNLSVDVEILVMDLLGNVVVQKIIDNMGVVTIDLKDSPKAVYILQIFQNGIQVQSKKIIYQ